MRLCIGEPPAVRMMFRYWIGKQFCQTTRIARRIIFLYVLAANAFSQQQKWVFANGPYQAEVHKFELYPLISKIIYAAVCGSEAGIYQSTNSGTTWSNISSNETFSNGYLEPVIALDPNDPHILFYGGHIGGGNYFKTTNDGVDWIEKSIKEKSGKEKIRCIAIDPGDSKVIYVGLANVFTTNDPIWKSIDGGDNWENRSSGIPFRDSTHGIRSVAAIETNPLKPSTILAGINDDGLFRSDNAAENWRYVGLTGYLFQDIEIIPWDTSIVFVGTGPIAVGLHRSMDGGMTWKKILPYDIRCITADPNTRTIYVGTLGNGAFESDDIGETWYSLSNPELPTSQSMAMDVFDIAVDGQEPNNIYLGTAIGPYKSTDGGSTFIQSFDGMRNFYAYDIRLSPSNPSIIYTIGRKGIHRSDNHGMSWRYIGGRGVFNRIAIDPVDPDIAFASLVGLDMTNYVYRTINGGQTWTIVSIIHSPAFISFIEIDRSVQRAVYTSAGVFLRSFDQGISWDTVSAPDGPSSLAIAEDDPNLLYISTRKGTYKSTNRGKTWDSLGLMSFGEQHYLYLDPKDANIIYASIVNHGVFRSTDGGYAWIRKNSGVDTSGYSSLILNHRNSDEIFLKNSTGIFRSTNRGEKWNLLFEHPPFSISGDYGITLDTSGIGRFLIGGNGFTGIYKLNLTTSAGKTEPWGLAHSIDLCQNYPNPFNPITTIEFTLSQKAIVTLDILDVLGRKIKNVLNSTLRCGKYSIVWDGTNETGSQMVSGIYFYRLNVENYHVSKKMILIH